MTRRSGPLIAGATRLGLAGTAVALGVLAGRALILDAPLLHADEVGHALPAARMALALQQGDLAAFASATLREVVWPFLHPWVIAAFFHLFGVSADVARLSSLLTFGAALCLIPAFARAVSGPDAEASSDPPSSMLGWLSVAILVATAPWGLVCAVMSEPLGMLLTVLTLWVAARAARGQGLVWPALSGLLAASAFFTKYGYGVPLVGAVLLAHARRPGVRSRPFLAALGGTMVPVAAWAAAVLVPNPHRAAELIGVLANRDEGLHGLENALFYGRVILDSLGWPLGIIVFFLLAKTTWRGVPAARLPATLLVGLALALLTLHPNKQQRYLFAALPVMLVLAETEAARLLRRPRRLPLVWPALAVLALFVRSPLARLEEEAQAAAPRRAARAIVAWIADNVPVSRPVLFLGTTGLLPHLALTWELLEREHKEQDVELLPFPGDRGWDPRFRRGYPAEPRPEYADVLGRALASARYGSVLSLRLGDASPFCPPWLAKWDAWGQNYVRAVDESAPENGYALRAERSFPAEDAVVRVFVREGTAPGG